MTEPTIVCPNCKTEIKLTESLSTLWTATSSGFEQGFASENTDIAKHAIL